MTPRRKLLAALVAGFALPRLALAQAAAQAQGPAMKQVIILHAGDAEDDEPAARPFFEELRRRGWSERVNIVYEHHSGRGMREYLETLAKTVAGKSPDLIYATTAATAAAAIKASEGVPVVFNSAADPVAAGLVQSLARPGRNATGTWQTPGNIMAGGYELLRQAMPGARRVGLVLDGRSADMQKQRAANEEAALKQGFEVVPGEFTNFEAVAKIMAQFRRQNVHAARLTPSFTLLARRREVVMAAERNEVALLGHRSEWAEAGAMISYGADIADALRRSAAIADRILKGAKAAEIPVERSTGLELVVNQRVANALGHTIPKQVLQRANRVIA